MEKYFFFCATAATFANFGYSVKNIFSEHNEAHRVGYALLKIGNVLAWLTTLVLFFYGDIEATSMAWIVGGLVQVFCLGFFLYLKRIAKKRLTIAFCLDLPTKLIKEGPYRWIRHPFYTCYLLSYLTVALIYQHPMTIFNFVFMLLIYIWAARLEEQKFSKSELNHQYVQYRSEAGMFWPKLRFPK